MPIDIEVGLNEKLISTAEAIKQVGKSTVVVEMTVKKAKDRLEKRGILYLDSEDDPKDKNNLGIAISTEAAAQLRKNGIADPAKHFEGKQIRVRGCVMRFEERYYLPVLDISQIQAIVDKVPK